MTTITATDWLKVADAIEAAELDVTMEWHGWDDEQTFDLIDGYSLRLRIRRDEDCTLDDSCGEGVCYGQLEETRDGDYGPRRPHDFDHHARILRRGSGWSTWWQPMIDSTWKGDEIAKAVALDWALIQRLDRDGFLGVGLELLGPLGPDDTWAPVVAEEWVWGVDSLDNGYLAELAKEHQSALAEERRTYARRHPHQRPAARARLTRRAGVRRRRRG